MYEKAKAIHIGQEDNTDFEVQKVSQLETTFRMGSWHFWVKLSSNKMTVIQLPFQRILKRINPTSGAQDMFVLLKTAHAENWIRANNGFLVKFSPRANL